MRIHCHIQTGIPHLHPLGKMRNACLLFLCLLGLTTCGEDGEDRRPYPSLITEFAELYTDGNGSGTYFVNDDGQRYAAHTPLQGLLPDAAYRLVFGYEPTGTLLNGTPEARIYTAETVTLLKKTDTPSSADAPTAVTAVWRGSEYLNLHLTPKTQGGMQEWGYRTDSVTLTSAGNTYHLSLAHRQPDDPFSYSATVYASLPLRPLGMYPGDSITFTALTFEGRRTWRFRY